MGEAKIEWADFTFNAWVGCTKVSEACHHCYTETWSVSTPLPVGHSGKIAKFRRTLLHARRYDGRLHSGELQMWTNRKSAKSGFNYEAPAQLFLPKLVRNSRIFQRRFPSAAIAIQFAVESRKGLLREMVLEVKDRRYGLDDIFKLYATPRFPLSRVLASKQAPLESM